MLKNITLENFKSFKKLDNLEIKPVTILCGANSCGKSSILQSLLMFKQTLESKNPNQNLVVSGRFAKLGYLNDLVYNKNADNELVFSFTITSDYSLLNNNNFIKYKLLLNPLKNKNTNFEYHIKELIIYWIDNDKKEKEIFKVIKNDNKYKIIWDNIENVVDNQFNLLQNTKYNGSIESEFIFRNLFPFISLNYEGNISYPFVLIDLLSNHMNNVFQSFSYLGPLRGEPEREYIYRNEIVEIGNKGENAAYLFLTEQEKQIREHFFYDKINDNFKQIKNLSLKDALNKWFDLMKVTNFKAEIINKIIYLTLNSNNSESTKVGIADVGFGVSQLFPILLEGLRINKGSTLLLEQPEIHLHPNLQMQLSDFFISLALSGKNVIAETHSDHIINRLVRRIVEDETHNLKDLIGIYFIKQTDEGSVIEEINIDETKGITNWPVDFFDQTANEQMKILQAGLKKRKNQRERKGNN